MNNTSQAIHKLQTNERLLWDIFLGGFGHNLLLIAHDIKLFSLLANQPLTAVGVAKALNIQIRPTNALLTFCTSVGILSFNDNYYSLTLVAEEYLLESSPTYFGAFLELNIANNSTLSFEKLKNAVLTNSSQVYDNGKLFQSHEEEVKLAKAFTHAMHGHSMGAALAWSSSIDLSKYQVLLDIGGGSGAHAIAAALKWSNLQSIVLDMPPVCEVAKEYIASYGLQSRVKTYVSNMWDNPFPVADIHFYADIYHDWPPEKGRFLTQKSFDTLESGGSIMIHEMLYNDEKTGPVTVANYNTAMLLWTEGQQYSALEISTMLSEVGFNNIEIKPTFGYWSIVTACKP
ncbi:acetylserotonin O-methyltransferase [Nostoc sp. CHAB 5836]|uniref:acetylserotonin O-methyltransferase n=1 Tax=Nostoc sp. CHAB 5836 TaxID=2780404 RepID=UPI001E30EDAF|nr:acetylserotonin O-methyltransferase [Nostoc sp. CHAB 5836]MCC5614376.1 acetylserotonin O-methyltransferase [Nostoc sp. CHAB 5836]